ncbi:MAG: pilus assembly protein PilM [Candidatus Omnitrophica bacterium]|nr:pilus assembly protein PilM [Candidatus Omnitrophota bacterium]MCM8798790.1 pilus assembly protein PilM [Candidatus Omnitrophota bacterium]
MGNLQTGINLGKYFIEVVQVNKTLTGYQLINQGKMDLTDIPEQELSGIQRSGYLKRFLEENRIEPLNVVTALPDNKVILRYFTIPMLPAKERESAIRFEAQKYIPFKLDEVASSLFTLPDKERKELRVVFVATKKDVLQEHLLILKEANIEPLAIETPAWALMRLLHALGLLSKKDLTALVYVEKNEAVITLCDQEIPYLVRDFSLTPSLETVNLNAYDHLLREIQLSLDYHYKHFPGLNIGKIILVGGNGLEEWAGNLFRDLKIPTLVANPGLIFGRKIGLTPGISIAVGLALRGFLVQDKRISLWEEKVVAPKPEKPREEEKAVLRRIFVGGTILGLAVMFFVQSTLSRQVKIIRDNLTQVKKVRERIGKEFAHKDKAELNNLHQEWRKRNNVFLNLLGKRLYLTGYLSEIPRLLPAGVWLENMFVESKFDDLLGSKSLKIIMEGKVFAGKQNKSESDLLNEFMMNIKNSPLLAQDFRKIELGFMEKGMEREFPVTRFRIICAK